MRIKGTLQQRQFARTLRRLREDAGLSLEEAGPKLDWSASKLGRIETAQQGVDVRSMLDLYHVGGTQWTEILELTREAKQKGWWLAYGQRLAGYAAQEAEVRGYRLVFDQLRSEALSPCDSVALAERLAADL